MASERGSLIGAAFVGSLALALTFWGMTAITTWLGAAAACHGGRW